ncbi:hypothetical protein [Pedobacter jejuensis]|uniref:DUF1801 domain-containing protein n=1 Tax=Pedobacter jejuensis TaxID=1268550 RepID=A0A3N0BT16_9SPHI|nr:hypothetical protein [Pedobacter jejuensis]RNL52239.1 hypothetical protein D7004_11755 [Pedobacter jejuensis]
MKTDLVEIFQTIRASLQPYAARGYTVKENSETNYVLVSEKNVIENDGKTTERFFVGIFINAANVDVQLHTSEFESAQDLVEFGDDKKGFSISELDEDQLKEIETFIEIIHTHFKEKGWV